MLHGLEDALGKYQALEEHGGSLNKRAKRGWKRLIWEPDDIRELRDRISSNIALLHAFLGGIYRYTFRVFLPGS